MQAVEETPGSIPLTPPGGIRWGVIGALLTLYIVWGSTYLAMRFAIATMPPFLMSGTRFLTAAILLFVVALVRGTSLPTRREAMNAGIVGVFVLGIGVGGTGFAE